VDELAQQPPLIRFRLLTLVRAGVLRAAGFRLEPTGRNPRHFTVAFDDLEAGVAADRGFSPVSIIEVPQPVVGWAGSSGR
jgi:hypothetical protein